MIQTQLLRLDPPYQIISAAGMVGIQIATLIVTEDKTTEDGTYAIETHSHPVVNYALKEEHKDDKQNKEISYRDLFPRLQPEGAVWNKVEISDIYVLGIAGESHSPMKLQAFLNLLPCSKEFDSWERVWDKRQDLDVLRMATRLNNVGMVTERLNILDYEHTENKSPVFELTLDAPGNCTPLVRVSIRSAEDDVILDCNRLFSCILYNDEKEHSIDKCIKNIARAINSINVVFGFSGKKAICKHRRLPVYKNNPLEDEVENVTKHVNAELSI